MFIFRLKNFKIIIFITIYMSNLYTPYFMQMHLHSGGLPSVEDRVLADPWPFLGAKVVRGLVTIVHMMYSLFLVT